MSRSSLAFSLLPQTVFMLVALTFVQTKEYPMAAFMGLISIVTALNLIIADLHKIKEIIKK